MYSTVFRPAYSPKVQAVVAVTFRDTVAVVAIGDVGRKCSLDVAHSAHTGIEAAPGVFHHASHGGDTVVNVVYPEPSTEEVSPGIGVNVEIGAAGAQRRDGEVRGRSWFS
jgi:hypothetical protein